MVEHKYGSDTPFEEQIKRQLQVVYAHQTRERQIFMEELKEYRRRRDSQMLKSMIVEVGPKWYQALSVPQRSALDTLEFSIYQDILEGRPNRTAAIMKQLGLFPRPRRSDLLNCIYLGRNDPKEMIAQLYFTTYGYPIEGKRTSYCLNARLMLSAILYLGLENLKYLLQQRFAPDASIPDPGPKPKPKPPPPLPSPYLERMVAALYEPPRYHRIPPPPLPNLDDLNEPYEEEPVMQKPPPPPPPPPPPKKKIPRSYCDKLAGIMNIFPHTSPSNLPQVNKRISRPNTRKLRSSKMSLVEGKKTYGIGIATRKKTARRKKPVAPSTGLANAQYTINGVFQVHGKTLYVLGNISILPAQGELIHGGYRYVEGECINIHCGFRGWPPAQAPDPCDCLKKWQETVFQYVKDNKCYCGHYYDYGNEGNYPADELPYFIKPTRHSPINFEYQNIFETDKKQIHIEKEFKKIWEAESMLHVDDPEGDGTNKAKVEKKKKKKRTSKTCLGQHPKPEDYLKCALRLMRRVNIAARLPDLHLVPELKEWMRHRLYGSLTVVEKKEFLRKSTTYWQMFSTLAGKGFGHVQPPKDPLYAGHTTWIHKQNLNDKFRRYTHRYKLSMFRSHAYVTNLLWRSMYQAEFPDKKFREIYFSYMFGRLEDIQLLHPYSAEESVQRKLIMAKRRYMCLPPGIEPKV